MKKLKIRGKELKRLGYESDKSISLALNIITKHFKRTEKTAVLEKLEKILVNPHQYTEDKIFAPLAQSLIVKPKPVRKEVSLRKDAPRDYKIYGKAVIENDAIAQMDMAMRLPIAVKGALMADAHYGYGLPIGGVLAADNAVIPYGVGMDIGCRMCLSIYQLPPAFIDKKRSLTKNILIENTRFGKAEFNDIREHEIMNRPEFKQVKIIKEFKDKIFRQLGTSGGGNHFVDAGIIKIPKEFSGQLKMDAGEYVAVLSHSGSRNFGANIAEYYTRIATAKRMLPKGAGHLAWLDLNEEEGQEYWIAMNFAGDYASANHHIIHNKISKALGEKPIKTIENHHNFAWEERFGNNEKLIIHRKGATPAGKGVVGIIPGSMATPAFVVVGKGNLESLESASHGAGRVMSRNRAKTAFTNKQLKQTLEKAGVELIGGDLDEAPMAYKDIHEVMEAQKELVEVVATFYPKIVRME